MIEILTADCMAFTNINRINRMILDLGLKTMELIIHILLKIVCFRH